MGRFKTLSQYYKTVFSLTNCEPKPVPERGELGIPIVSSRFAGVCGPKPKTPTKHSAQEKLTSGYHQVDKGDYT